MIQKDIQEEEKATLIQTSNALLEILVHFPLLPINLAIAKMLCTKLLQDLAHFIWTLKSQSKYVEDVISSFMAVTAVLLKTTLNLQ